MIEFLEDLTSEYDFAAFSILLTVWDACFRWGYYNRKQGYRKHPFVPLPEDKSDVSHQRKR